jgi:hypothetical protein|tara:strand:- start:174 stop:377 length:204 start_codon:yes stop_codon:yes gene_type:complete
MKKENTQYKNNIPWDAIQRRRFMNADAEIAPNDSYTMRLENGDEFKVRKNSTSTDNKYDSFVEGEEE